MRLTSFSFAPASAERAGAGRAADEGSVGRVDLVAGVLGVLGSGGTAMTSECGRETGIGASKKVEGMAGTAGAVFLGLRFVVVGGGGGSIDAVVGVKLPVSLRSQPLCSRALRFRRLFGGGGLVRGGSSSKAAGGLSMSRCDPVLELLRDDERPTGLCSGAAPK
jgi:hypothetical protein